MSKNKAYNVTCEIKTDYNIKELMEVIDKLFCIPGLQYEDCECFECKRISIIEIETRRKIKKWKAL